MPQPPRSTLFPYTTLFRSQRRASNVTTGSKVRAGRVAPRWAFSGVSQARTLDRKSTRLNSSHMSISYAVFCLKKKNVRVIQLALHRLRVVDVVRRDVALYE